ncbi:MAG: ribosome silencing factor [Gammaproteobacteria bacterium]|nr:ribosome silencing factor [Gammaproteobacteria bacterium]
MSSERLAQEMETALDDTKAFDIRVLDVRALTTVTDFMVIASGRSDRQVKAMAGHVVERAKALGVRPLGVEGERAGEWVLIDLGDVIVHAMQAHTRDFYQLEKLWDVVAQSRQRVP